MALYLSLPEFKAACPAGALLGLDIGTKTIGVAASDGRPKQLRILHA